MSPVLRFLSNRVNVGWMDETEIISNQLYGVIELGYVWLSSPGILIQRALAPRNHHP